MTAQVKATLIDYFGTGETITQQDMTDLVDTIPPRGATLTVAASDATASFKATADYLCDGTADEAQINSALDALGASGGTVLLSEGTFTVANAGSVVADSVTTPYCIRIRETHGPINLIGMG